ncbi:hypothetical protein JAAARDRAFT_39938 [Jaapia argillacea MUCL 33604]|uniref:Uncharacterized protein n=1 Tax=Jaapia argillacea MUCL 33604 TaxID=933084 RepID=A0A067PD19_9AGAM|nr:hypothetical protein JAAARDRAFT_39938 [Jaapia argillacea MUCL 33604]
MGDQRLVASSCCSVVVGTSADPRRRVAHCFGNPLPVLLAASRTSYTSPSLTERMYSLLSRRVPPSAPHLPSCKTSTSVDGGWHIMFEMDVIGG